MSSLRESSLSLARENNIYVHMCVCARARARARSRVFAACIIEQVLQISAKVLLSQVVDKVTVFLGQGTEVL